MIVKDGEKFACDACIRGHRVSSCTHKDRKLNHVNKKGRPVSQCQHCRGLRKARASHVRCECGEKNHTQDGSASDSSSNCQCPTGKRCTCALKKDSLDDEDVMHGAPLVKSASNNKPGMRLHQSESAVPRLRAPHHPITHRLNNAAHELGQPYTLPKSRPMSSGMPNVTPVDSAIDQTYQPQYEATAQQSLPRTASPFANDMSPAGSLQRANTTRDRPKPPALCIANSSQINLSELDNAVLYNAISAGNPHRYSLNDFSMFTLEAMSQSQDLQEPAMLPLQEPMERPDLNWADWNDPAAFGFNDATLNQIPITPSDHSVEHNIGLSRSSSGTVSEAEDMGYMCDYNFTDPNGLAAGLPANWDMTDLVPGLTNDNFDTDFGAYLDPTNDAAAGAFPGTPTENTSPFAQQPSDFVIPTQSSYEHVGPVPNVDQLLADYPPSQLSQTFQQGGSSYKDEEVRNWLTADPDSDAKMDVAVQEFVAQQQHQQQQQPRQPSMEGFMAEPTWL